MTGSQHSRLGLNGAAVAAVTEVLFHAAGPPGDMVCFQTCGELWQGGNICCPRASATVMDGQVCCEKCVRALRSGTQDMHSAWASPAPVELAMDDASAPDDDLDLGRTLSYC